MSLSRKNKQKITDGEGSTKVVRCIVYKGCLPAILSSVGEAQNEKTDKADTDTSYPEPRRCSLARYRSEDKPLHRELLCAGRLFAAGGASEAEVCVVLGDKAVVGNVAAAEVVLKGEAVAVAVWHTVWEVNEEVEFAAAAHIGH